MALTDKLTAIADAIRLKRDTTTDMTLDDMALQIGLIEGGGGGALPFGMEYYDTPIDEIVNIPNALSSSSTVKTYDIPSLPDGGNVAPFYAYIGFFKAYKVEDVIATSTIIGGLSAVIYLPNGKGAYAAWGFGGIGLVSLSGNYRYIGNNLYRIHLNVTNNSITNKADLVFAGQNYNRIQAGDYYVRFDRYRFDPSRLFNTEE